MILEGLRNFGRGGVFVHPNPPPRYATVTCYHFDHMINLRIHNFLSEFRIQFDMQWMTSVEYGICHS